MAKQLVSPLERHVDKAVLGLAGLILLGSSAKFLVTSPNQLDLGGEAVSPSTIDRKVAQAAGAARDRMRNAPSNVEPVEPIYSEFEASLTPFETAKLARTLPAGVQFGTVVPLIDQARPEGSSKLVKVVPVAPDPPLAIHGRSLFWMSETQREAINWVTVSVRFHVKEQMAEQGSEYGAARKAVTFGPLEMQRRARRADGSWSDDDWIIVRNNPAGKLPPVPRIELAMELDRVFVPSKDQQLIDEFAGKLSKPELQLEIIRPQMHRWVPGAGDQWSVPEITSEADVVTMDAYYQEVPGDRYFDGAEAEGLEEIPVAEQLDKAERDRIAAWKNKSKDAMTDVFNIAITIEDDETVSQSLRKRAADLRRRANLHLADIQRLIARGDIPGAGGAGGGEVVKKPLPFQQLWAHDAQPGGVKSGTTYQYRVRPLIYNRLAGEPDKFQDKANAQVVFIAGDWTQAVEVVVRPDTYFWVTGEDKRNERVNVEVYKWQEGVWAKSSRFKFSVGDDVHGESRHDLPPWDVGGEPENALVDYATNTRVVDIDFKRRFRERKKGKGRDGVKFAAPKEVCSVVLVDSAGRLQERFVPLEKNDPIKRQIVPYKPPKDE